MNREYGRLVCIESSHDVLALGKADGVLGRLTAECFRFITAVTH